MERNQSRESGAPGEIPALPGFWEYLVEYRGAFGLLLLFTAIHGLVFFGYRLPAEAVVYSALLCLCAAGPVILWHYRSFRTRAGELIQMQQALMSDPKRYFLEDCPPAATAMEQIYRQFLVRFAAEREREKTRASEARAEMLDYYTLWVHQVKTPIAAMRLLLQSRGEERELMQQLFLIEEYVNLVLQYLRLDGGSDLVIKRCDLDGIVRQAVHKYAGMFIGKKLRLTYNPLNVQVLTDEKWLVFVVEQILSNAVKYTRTGGVTISLEPGPQTVLVIRDTGIGIAWEDQPRIFEKGFTGCNGRADKRSTGIGLYLCRRILDRLSHKITVESEPGKGTVIRIAFDREPLAPE